MSTLNYEKALEVVEEWIDKLDERGRVSEHLLDEWFTERQPLIERIGAKFGITSGWSKWSSPVSWQGTRTAAIRLRGELKQRQERLELFPAPAGPRLRADALHPWVWDAARRLWSDGHPRAAVGNAASTLEVMLQAKLGREDVSGSKLVGEAFSLEPPAAGRSRLRLPGLTDETSERWRSAHIGALHLGQGCYEGIRNWAAHTVADADEQVALEHLAALSVFARWVDQAEVREA